MYNPKCTLTTPQRSNIILDFQNFTKFINLFHSEKRYHDPIVFNLLLDEDNELNSKSCCKYNADLNNATEFNTNAIYILSYLKTQTL